MLKNYLRTAIRSLLKNKGFTTINVVGLSLGLAACLLIVFYVVDERSYDRYNVKADRIYRINTDIRFGGKASSSAATEPPLAAAIKTNFPEVEKTLRLRPAAYSFSGRFYVRKGNENIRENDLIFTESALFDLFTLPMVEGDPSTALNDPHTAVITESAARKYFSRTNVLGEDLLINDTSSYRITGVIKDMPAQSHFRYALFLSSSTLPEFYDDNWYNGGWNTYLLLKPGTDIRKLEAGIQKLTDEHVGDIFTKTENYLRHNLSALPSIHLYSDRDQELAKNGSIQYIYIFSAIALFILLIACVNFMNLSTARSSNRAREVGVRKVLGSARSWLITQFLTESILVVFASTLVALLLAWMLLPLFNQLAAKELVFTIHSLTWLLPVLFAIVLVVGVLAGSYPAFFLSAFRPIDVLKGKIAKGFKGSFLRSFLVVFQFAISIFLIIGTLVIYNQLNYIHSKGLGYDRSQVLVIKNANVLGQQAQLLKQEVKQLSGVRIATLSGFLPTGEVRQATALFNTPVVDAKQVVKTEFWAVDEDYINTLGIQMIAGRNFSKEMATDSSAIIVNEAYAKMLNAKDPLNRTVYRRSYGVQPYHIVGVFRDFHFNSLREHIEPLVLFYKQDRGALSARVSTTHLPALLSKIEGIWKKLSPNQQFSYSFMDQDFDTSYRSEQRIGQIFMVFSTLAILIACLGLFGLAAYAAEQRTKEIGIRKVLGANVSVIVKMLSMDFIKLVLIALLISGPIAWLVMQRWLQDFAYRVDMHWWIVGIAGFIALLIAFITISFQSIRAAVANPVESLRSE